MFSNRLTQNGQDAQVTLHDSIGIECVRCAQIKLD